MRTLAVIACAAAALACAGSRPEERGAAAATPAAGPAGPRGATLTQGAREMCPMEVPDTTVEATDTADGEALTFTTRSPQVDELRRRVRALAEIHNAGDAGADHVAADHGQGDHAERHHGEGATAHPQGEHGDHHGHHGPPPASRATVEDVERGARVLVVPTDPAQADALRAAARMHAMHMQHHGCGAMHGGPRG